MSNDRAALGVPLQIAMALAASLPNGAAFIAERLSDDENLSNTERARLAVAKDTIAALAAAGFAIVPQARAAEAERVRAALISENEIAHGEAVTPDPIADLRGLGWCAYCRDVWPCRTQRGINRLLAILDAEVAP